MAEFNRLCPHPEPNAVVFTKTGKKPNYNDAQYKADVIRYGKQRWGYTILKTLAPSNLTFDGISIDDPETWDLVEPRLMEELGHFEFGKVMALVDEANSLDAEKLEANLESFFLQLAKEQAGETEGEGTSKPTIQSETKAENSSSSKPANVGA
jgi:hypothetical protein